MKLRMLGDHVVASFSEFEVVSILEAAEDARSETEQLIGKLDRPHFCLGCELRRFGGAQLMAPVHDKDEKIVRFVFSYSSVDKAVEGMHNIANGVRAMCEGLAPRDLES